MVARGLANAALAGAWEVDTVVAGFARALGLEEAPWMRRVARKLCAAFAEPPAEPALLAPLIEKHPGFVRAIHSAAAVTIRRPLLPEPRMQPRFDVPLARTAAELAELLAVVDDELDWLADVRGMNRCAPDERLEHYRYRWIAKRSGGRRLLEAPKERLKAIQRALLDRVLAHIPPHDRACGFVAARSVIDHARAHVGRAVVVRLDLESFFWSIDGARVRGIFRSAGYPPPVAAYLAGLTTTRTPLRVLADIPVAAEPHAIFERFTLRRRLAGAHLPQGAPTSGALANLCAFTLDRRLSGLGRRFGADYTRYADDLAFSGGPRFERALARFLPRVGAVVLDEGFAIQHRKTRVMRASQRQQLCGLVVNRRVAMTRIEREKLEAILVNCVRRGPQAENRAGHPDFRAHLAGRVAWASHLAADQGAHFRDLFARISWDS